MREQSLGRRLRNIISDPDEARGLATTLRRRRWATFAERFPAIADMRVVDLGGTSVHWTTAPVRPRAVTVVNLLPEQSDVEWMTTVQGDACELPPEVEAGAFDLVYSNSLIEHVGGHAQRTTFADNVRALAPHHWVQTPYRYFPVEPHWLFPGLQFLPPVARAAAIRHWPLGPARPSRVGAMEDVLGVELLSRSELAHYFADSEILAERVLGLTKSLIATR